MSRIGEKQPLEYLTDEQLDDFLTYSDSPFSEENRKNIKKQFQNKKTAKLRKRRFNYRLVGFAALAASVLLFTAFTFRDELRLIYQKHFGSEMEVLLANSDRLSQEVEDQGLKLKAVSSFKDGSTTYFISQLTDLSGDRLAADTVIERWQMLNGGNSRTVDYDKKTKTATILTQAIDWGEGNSPGYVLESFTSKNQEFKETYQVQWQSIEQPAVWRQRSALEGKGGGADQAALEELDLDWETLSDNYLQPAEEPLVLGEYAAISALAFKDGLLHLQTRELNTVGSATFVNLQHRKTGAIIQELASYSVDAGTHNNETGRSDYYEHVFPISEKELPDYDLVAEGWTSKVSQKGQWAIQLQTPKELPAINLANQNLNLNGGNVQFKNIRLSPISLSFDYIGNLTDTEIELQLEDGSTKRVSLDYLDEKNQEDYYEWQFGLVELADVTGIKINQQKLEMK